MGQLELNLNPSTSLIKKVKRKNVLPFLKKHHYLGGVAMSAMIYGSFNSWGELEAVISFNTPCSEAVRKSILGTEYRNSVIELSRLAISPSCTFTASEFVSKSIKILISERRARDMNKLRVILSFADQREGHHGGVYQAMSWLYCGKSISSQKRIYRDKEGAIRHPRQCGKNISRSEAKKLGWTVEDVTPLGKYRYIKLVGSKKEKRQSKNLLKFKVLPYPKPEPQKEI